MVAIALAARRRCRREAAAPLPTAPPPARPPDHSPAACASVCEATLLSVAAAELLSRAPHALLLRYARRTVLQSSQLGLRVSTSSYAVVRSLRFLRSVVIILSSRNDIVIVFFRNEFYNGDKKKKKILELNYVDIILNLVRHNRGYY